MRFEKVGMEKLEDLVKTRIQVLRAAQTNWMVRRIWDRRNRNPGLIMKKVWRMEAMWPILYTTGT